MSKLEVIISSGFLILVGILFFLLNRFSLFICDDHIYSFIYGTNEIVRSFNDIIHSQWHHYFEQNGRFLVHCVVQYFCSFGSVEIFRILNSVVFVAFLSVSSKLIFPINHISWINLLIVLVFIWYFIPVPGMTFLGNISLSVNYLWTSTAILFFILIYEKIRTCARQLPLLFNISLFVFGIVCGSLQESFSIGVAVALFCYYLFKIREFKGSIAYLISGFFIGTAIVVLAPGNFNRMNNLPKLSYDNNQSFVTSTLLSIISHLLSLKICILLTFLLVLLYFKNKIEFIKFLKKNFIYLISAIVTFFFIVFIAFTDKHQYTSISVFLIILSLKTLFQLRDRNKKKYKSIIIPLLILFFGCTYYPVYRIREEVSNSYNNFIKQAYKANDRTLNGTYHIHHYLDSYINSGKFRYRFIGTYSYMGSDSRKEDLSKYLTKGKNPELIDCTLPFSPERLVAFCNESNRTESKNLFYTDNYPFFLVCLNDTLKAEKNKIRVCYPRSEAGKIKNRFVSRSENIVHYIEFIGYDKEPFTFQGNNYIVIWNPYANKNIISSQIVNAN